MLSLIRMVDSGVLSQSSYNNHISKGSSCWTTFGDCVSHIVIQIKLPAYSSTHFCASVMSSFTLERPNMASWCNWTEDTGIFQRLGVRYKSEFIWHQQKVVMDRNSCMSQNPQSSPLKILLYARNFRFHLDSAPLQHT